MSFKDGRIGVGKDPIFPLDISGSCRIDGDLILGGRFSDSQGNPIQLGGGSGATSTPDQNQDGLPSWEGGTITTQGLGVFKGHLHYTNRNILITANNAWNASTTGVSNTSCGYASGMNITSGTHNTLMGDIAGMSINTGTYNTCLGYKSGYNITNGNSNVTIGKHAAENMTSSAENVFIGSYSGSKLTTGCYHNVGLGYGSCGGGGATATNLQDNVCLGQSAGGNMTSGSENIFLGKYSGLSCTTGSNNICIGKESGRNKTNKTNMIAIGNNALNSDMGGAQCIAIGIDALKGVAGNNHYDNIAIGFQAMRAVTTATNCVVIGYDAGVAITSGAGNVLIGSDVGKGMTTGSSNIAIGRYAMWTGNVTGHYNTIMGCFSGYTLTTGSSNVAIGNQCLRTITTSSYTVGIGYQAGYSTTTSATNVYIGHRPGYNITVGHNNVAIGNDAMYYGTNWAYTVAIGYKAHMGGSSNGSGSSQNVALGYMTMYSVTSGHNNIAMGQASMYPLTTGTNNVAIGNQSARYLSTATSNTFVGAYSGHKCTGNYNTHIGNRAGYEITSGSFNTCIGQQAGEKCTTGESNVYIGHNANYFTTTGKYNIAIGRHSGCTNGTGGSEGDYKLYIGMNETGVPTSYGSASYIYGYMKMDDNPSFEAAKAFFKTSGNYMYFGHRDNSASYTSYYAIRRDGSTRKTALSGSSIELKIDNHQPTATLNTTGLFIGGGSALQATYLDIGYNSSMAAGGVSNTNGAKAHDNTWNATDYHMWVRLSGQPSATSSYNCRIGFGNGHQDTVSGSPTFGPAGYIGMHMGGHGNNQYNGAACGGDLVFGAAGTGDVQLGVRERMRIVGHNGNVGIGTNTPGEKLEVDGRVHATNGFSSTHLTASNGTQLTYTGSTNSMSYYDIVGHVYSIYDHGRTNGAFTGSGFSGNNWTKVTAINVNIDRMEVYQIVFYSDKRIKTNIEDVPDNLALQTVRDIPCRYYNYRDNEKFNNRYKTIGFIAQEVAEIFPEAILKEKGIIPNIGIFLTNEHNTNIFSWEQDISNNKWKLTIPTINDLIIDNSDNIYEKCKVKFTVTTKNENDYKQEINDASGDLIKIKEIKERYKKEEKEIILEIEDDLQSFIFDEKWDNVFLYGTEVKDLLTVDKQKIFALNFSATQELDRKVTALETVVNQDHNVKILDLYKENEALKARLAKLEAFLGI